MKIVVKNIKHIGEATNANTLEKLKNHVFHIEINNVIYI